jgi:hypothetical protein
MTNRHIVEIARTIEPSGRIHIEPVNGTFLFRDNGSHGRVRCRNEAGG